ncbi:MAG: SRPBCC family protein [Actinomycetota bacterium]|nr:SRPBCC family protein [Actinomycetota bacterium]
MKIENSFEVPAPTETVWDYMLDIEKVVPCMPGASLTETIDDTHWKGKLTVKLGPVSLNFAGKVEMSERDDEAHRVVLQASGMEQRGKGAASATVTSNLESFEGGTRVLVVQDLKVSGQAAQFSRGMMQDVSAKLTKKFADCLKANMTIDEQAASAEAPAEANPDAAEVPAPSPQKVKAKPVGGIRLALGALVSAVIRFFKGLFGRKKT